MRAPSFGGVLGLLAVVAACGRSSLDVQAPTLPNDPSCHDATLAGAPTPAVGFCSDGSHRAPTLAPLAPHVVWSVHLASTGPFVVDDRATIQGPRFTVDGNGVATSRSTSSLDVAFLDPSGRIVGRATIDHEITIVARTPNGTMARIATPPDFPTWDIGGAPGDDGTFDLTLERRGPLSGSIGAIDRIDAQGNHRFVADTGCAPKDGDISTPTTTLRLADGGVASACANWRNRTVTVRAFDREGNPSTTIDLAAETVRSNMAQTPDGALALVTAAPVGSKVWVLRPPAVVAEFNLTDPGDAYVAVARDGTVLVRTASELLAFAAHGADRWTQRFHVATAKIEPLLPMGGVGAAPLFVDADSTIVTWDATLEGRAIDDGALRWSIPAPPMHEFTYVTAAGPRALYATTSDGTLMLLRDP